MKEESVYRIFIGGLAPDVKEDDVRDKFKSFGSASEVYLVHKKNSSGEILKTFGYLNLKTTEQQLNKCFAIFGGTKWKGYNLKVQLARDDFMKRLRKEWEDPEPVKISKSRKRKQSEPIKSYEEFISKCQNLKKMLPGIPIEGEKNWVIGKYGRPLPIVHIPKIPGKRAIKHDPSKHCHCIKKIYDDDLSAKEGNRQKLTWEMEEIKHLQDNVKPMKRVKKTISDEPLGDKEKDKQLIEKEELIEKVLKETNHTPKVDAKPDIEILPEIKNPSDQNVKSEEVEPDFEIVPQVEIKRSIVINSRFDSSDSDMSDVEEPMQKSLLKSKKDIKPKDKQISESKSLKKVEETTQKNELSKSNKNIKPKETKSEIEMKDSLDIKPTENETPEPKSNEIVTVDENEEFEPVKIKKNIEIEEVTDTSKDEKENISEVLTNTVKIELSTPKARSSETSKDNKLSDSIVKQLKSVTKASQSTPAKLNISNCIDYDDDGSEDEERIGTSMFDFNFDNLESHKEGKKDSKENQHAIHQNEANENEVDNDDEDKKETEINMFDFKFENLKNSIGKDFLQNMELKWENDQDGSNSSEEDSTSNHEDEDVSFEKNKVQTAVTEDSTDDEIACDVTMFDFEFENMGNRTGAEFLEKMELRWENEQDGSISSEDDLACEDDSEPKIETKKKNEKVQNIVDETDEMIQHVQKIEKSINVTKKEKENQKEITAGDENDDTDATENRTLNQTKQKIDQQNDEALKTSKRKKKDKTAVNENLGGDDKNENIEVDEPKPEMETTQQKKIKKKKDKTTVDENINKDEPSVDKKKKKDKKKKDKNTKDDSKSKHHTPGMSEEVRLKSLDAFNERTLKNKELIKNALKGLDINQPSANRICFDDDDDDDEIIADMTESNVQHDNVVEKKESSLLDESENEDEELKEKKMDKEEIANFLDGSDIDSDENDVNDSDRFAVKPQFQGKEGGKLFKMQLHYGGDERFRLDERFADENDDNLPNNDNEIEEESSEESLENSNECENLEEEKWKNLSLLENVLGKVIKTNKKNKREKLNSITPYDRYDPTKTEHTNLEVQREEKPPKEEDTEVTKKKKEKDVKMDDKEEVALPEVSKERFYEVDTSLKSLFSSSGTEKEEKSATTFTFLSTQNDEPIDDEEDNHVIEAKPIKEVSWRKGLDEDDGGDIVMDDEGEEEKNEQVENGKKTAFQGFFFLNDEDKRLQKGSTFKRSEEFTEIRKQWENVRQSLRDDFKKKHKDAVRRVRKMKEQRGFKRP